MFSVLLTSVAAFIGTNLDDIFLLTLFFSEAETKKKARAVVCGQYLGILLLYVLSVLGALGLSFLPEKYIGFLGILPIILGVKAIFDKDDEDDGEQSAFGGALRVALVTVANGADNLGVYIPLFVGFSAWQTATAGVVFLLMTALWCIFGKKFSEMPFLRRFLAKYKRILVPCVLILLGMYILAEAFFL